MRNALIATILGLLLAPAGHPAAIYRTRPDADSRHSPPAKASVTPSPFVGLGMFSGSKGNLLEFRRYSGDNVLVCREVLAYDQKTDTTESKVYRGQKELVGVEKPPEILPAITPSGYEPPPEQQGTGGWIWFGPGFREPGACPVEKGKVPEKEERIANAITAIQENPYLYMQRMELKLGQTIGLASPRVAGYRSALAQLMLQAGVDPTVALTYAQEGLSPRTISYVQAEAAFRRQRELVGLASEVGTRKQITTYDTKGNLTEFREYGPNGALARRKVYSYDTEGNLTEFKEYKTRGVLVVREEYIYGPMPAKRVLLFTAPGAELQKMTEGRQPERRQAFGRAEAPVIIVDMRRQCGCEGKLASLEVMNSSSRKVVCSHEFAMREGYCYPILLVTSGATEDAVLGPGSFVASLTWDGAIRETCSFSIAP